MISVTGNAVRRVGQDFINDDLTLRTARECNCDKVTFTVVGSDHEVDRSCATKIGMHKDVYFIETG